MSLPSPVCFVANGSFVALCLRSYTVFRRALSNVERVQERYLRELLSRNRHTAFGRRHGFARLGSVAEFCRDVPLSEYEDYAPYIARIAAGERSALTADPVRLFEPSSGTISASKLIPYNEALRAEFQSAIDPWLFALFRHHPAVMAGQSYWSITPAVGERRYHGDVPVGFDEDADYLGVVGRLLYARISAVPARVAQAPSMEDFKDQTLVHLLAARELAFISVWSPTFLSGLLDHLAQNASRILDKLARSHLPGARGRAGEVRELLASRAAADSYDSLWPGLAVVSCWTHGPSARYAAELSHYLARPVLQPKGLLATEAVTSIPLCPGVDPVLAVRSHFFEFLAPEGGAPKLAHELELGRRYEVIVTTGGGLYRYRTRDEVEITGFIDEAPTMRFVSKLALVSDLFGEKLNAAHVAASVDAALERSGLSPSFVLVAPTEAGGKPCYALFVAAGELGERASALRAALDARLDENFHYAHCQRLGQLGPLKVFAIDSHGCKPEAVFHEELTRRGQRAGAIKPAVLDRELGWERRFAGVFLC